MSQPVLISQQLYAWSDDLPSFASLGLPWFPVLAVLFLGIGFVLASSFLVLEVSTARSQHNLFKEISLALPASVCLGIGFLYFLQSVGIYV